MYLVIGPSDTECFIESLSKDELERRINQNYYGNHTIFLTAIPNISIGKWPENAVLIVRAESFVAPRTVEIVTRRTVD